MIETSISSIDTEELMAKIHEEVQKNAQRSSSVITAEISSFLDRMSPPGEQNKVPVKETYTAEDFFEFTDHDFVLNAYQVFLQRDPHPDELSHLIDLLSRGERTKNDILGSIRYSPEGKKKDVRVKGMYLTFLLKRMSRVPVVGIFLKILICIYRLPSLFQNVLQLNSNIKNVYISIQRLEEAHVAALRSLLTAVNDLEDKFGAWNLQHSHKTDILLKDFDERQRAEMDNFLAKLECIRQKTLFSPEAIKLETVNAVKEELNTRMPDILTIQRLLLEFEKKYSSSSTPSSPPQLQNEESLEPASAESISIPLDLLYLSLENRFRGTNEDVRNRLKVYLPYVQDVLLNLPKGKALDVACGRGEWLEILQDIPMPAVGVDLNAGMLEVARQRGLQVVCDDLFDYLQGVGDESLALISGFHIVEHLSFEQLVFLLDESFRSLQEGGLAIFETPNPENLLTGACNFYIDPTHKNPIPPPLLEFLLKARGFRRVEVLRLHPNDSIQLDEKIVQDMLFGPQDYAVLGWK